MCSTYFKDYINRTSYQYLIICLYTNPSSVRTVLNTLEQSIGWFPNLHISSISSHGCVIWITKNNSSFSAIDLHIPATGTACTVPNSRWSYEFYLFHHSSCREFLVEDLQTNPAWCPWQYFFSLDSYYKRLWLEKVYLISMLWWGCWIQ